MEINNNNYEYLRNQVGPALQSKLEEFQILGYRDISEPQLWEYLLKKKWKKVTEEMKLHQAIQDIFSVKVSDYMNFATVELYKAAEFSLDNEEDWKELFK
ncbi:MAG: post-transcriptional regulator [Bacillota bacterium]|nr:post-transcriptional regulator [Bacillota bacterium]